VAKGVSPVGTTKLIALETNGSPCALKNFLTPNPEIVPLCLFPGILYIKDIDIIPEIIKTLMP
jgi:hypothetical protein